MHPETGIIKYWELREVSLVSGRAISVADEELVHASRARAKVAVAVDEMSANGLPTVCQRSAAGSRGGRQVTEPNNVGRVLSWIGPQCVGPHNRGLGRDYWDNSV